MVKFFLPTVALKMIALLFDNLAYAYKWASKGYSVKREIFI